MQKTALDGLIERASKKCRPVVLDGAVGTELDNRGVDTGSPVWSGLAPLRHPELLKLIHNEYVAAGSEIVTTCTFRTTRRAFAAAGMPDGLWRESARAAVRAARASAGTGALVAGSVGPLEDCFSPQIAPRGKEAVDEHLLLCEELVRAGVDLLLLETFGTSGEIESAATAAYMAARSKGVPFGLSVTTGASGDLISGERLRPVVDILGSLGCSFIGVNCVPPNHVNAALEILTDASQLPVAVYANLGRAEEGQDWSGSAHVDPEEYADLVVGWADAGASIVGGCCGSNSGHIGAIFSRYRSRL